MLSTGRANRPPQPWLGAFATDLEGKVFIVGYWEYVLDDAIFIAPAHPFWGGAALIDAGGRLLGVGSLQIEQKAPGGESGQLNMVVPIDLLKPILGDMLSTGRANRPPQPWLGAFATDLEGKVFIVGVYSGAPAARAGLKPGDLVTSVGGEPVTGLAGFFRRVWSLGPAGASVPIIVQREGETVETRVVSSEREKFLKKPKMHS